MFKELAENNEIFKIPIAERFIPFEKFTLLQPYFDEIKKYPLLKDAFLTYEQG